MKRHFVRISLSLYPEDIQLLDKLASKLGFSRSELIRFIITGLVNEEKFIYFKRLFDK